MEKLHKRYVMFASIGLLILGGVIMCSGDGLNFLDSSKADNSLGISVSTEDFKDSFTKKTKLGNNITFRYQNNTLSNETMLTGLNAISFTSLNDGLCVSTGYIKDDFLYERYLFKDDTNSYTVSLLGECFVSISPLNKEESINIENLTFDYSCSMSSNEYFDSRLNYTYNSTSKTFSVTKATNAFGSTDKNKVCLIPMYYVDPTYGKHPVTSISNSAFNGCYFEKVHIPRSITSIGNLAFNQCWYLDNVYVPDSVASFGYTTFGKCYGLTNIRLSERLVSTGDSCFADCTLLEKIHLPDSITTLGASFFSGCSSLKDVNCPRGITSLKTSVFNYATSLESFTITSNVTSLGSGVFKYCSSLEKIYYEGTMTQFNKLYKGFYNNCPLLKTIICSDGEISL